MLSEEQLANLLCASLQEPMAKLVRSSYAAHTFSQDPEQIAPLALVRHIVEHVFRIRMFRPLDAAATRILSKDYGDIAIIWAKYARSESVHDRYYLRDLGAIGLERNMVDGMHPFHSTMHLGEFIGRAMRDYGALPVVLYSFWTEHNSKFGSQGVIKRTEQVFGSKATRGAAAHRVLDDGQDHPAVISHVLSQLIQDTADVYTAVGLLNEITQLIQNYFEELGEWNSNNEPTKSSAQSKADRVHISSLITYNEAP